MKKIMADYFNFRGIFLLIFLEQHFLFGLQQKTFTLFYKCGKIS